MRSFAIWSAAGIFILNGVFGLAQTMPDGGLVGFEFRTPRRTTYRMAPPPRVIPQFSRQSRWALAWPDSDPANPVQIGDRLVLEVASKEVLARALAGGSLRVARGISPSLFVLQAPDIWTAASEAQRLAALPGVLASYPLMRRRARLDGPYAAEPNDPYFGYQWYLENRNSNGATLGVNMNVRAAWPISTGSNVLIAVADDGVELDHPELAKRAAGAPHFNFYSGTPDGNPSSPSSAHGTAVAGLAAAEANNHRGVTGVAPQAHLASWVIFSADDYLPSEEQMMDMYQYQSNLVSVENHSWGNAGSTPLEPGVLEQTGISNAVTWGRGGRGVVMVRSAGNGRNERQNANDDGYASSPLAIAVGAVRQDGRAASYSNPGACLLVAAPSGDDAKGFPTLLTTDLVGANGYNQIAYTNDLADYTSSPFGFSGTSAAAPQISGLVALILGANPNLTYRDVQQILIQSARHWDLADPDMTTNGAGFRVSHNVGFGVPDAGFAVRMARTWINRPPVSCITFTSTEVKAIPDDALRLLISGDDIPPGLASIHSLPGEGPHPDAPTAVLPLVKAGLATNAIPLDLT
ncbi:MAG: S8 family serine peptidase, partial [Candidatus Omnitrophica bacterium]|nr:S8 family serine peptidase [Candidatus Omnitrophota bacterium]